jgi:hypothetical protein
MTSQAGKNIFNGEWWSSLFKTDEIIDHNEIDHNGMYILPECIASIKSKWLNKDDSKSPNDKKFH